MQKKAIFTSDQRIIYIFFSTMVRSYLQIIPF